VALPVVPAAVGGSLRINAGDAHRREAGDEEAAAPDEGRDARAVQRPAGEDDPAPARADPAESSTAASGRSPRADSIPPWAASRRRVLPPSSRRPEGLHWPGPDLRRGERPRPRRTGLSRRRLRPRGEAARSRPP
jgi:hypothetical protein